MVHIRDLGLMAYQPVFDKMKSFTLNRQSNTVDELWLLEHPPVYTQGQAGKKEHLIQATDIPIVQSDRGGQVTYHGPGQLMAYTLLNLKKRQLTVRSLVTALEQVIILLLQSYKINANSQCNAPGVYVKDKKIASLGLRIKNGYSYHGIALNVRMDLQPFNAINPCGFSQLKMTQMKEYEPNVVLENVKKKFVDQFLTVFES